MSNRRTHFDMVTRAAAGTLTDVERAALVVLLDRLLVAVELTETEGPDAGWWVRVTDGFRTLQAAEVPEPRPAGGAEVRALRSTR